jgi:hypothetical protein
VPKTQIAERLQIAEGACAHAVAALRECLEECGLWLGAQAAPDRVALASARRQLLDGSADMAALSVELGLPLSVSALLPWSHWVTPIDLDKRFDTRFFVVAAPPNQQPGVDDGEAIMLVWVQPADALARHARGELPLEFATRSTLESLRPFDSAAALLAHAGMQREIAAIHPRVAWDREGRRHVLVPSDAAYDEVVRQDPEGRGDARFDAPALHAAAGNP